jgi:hypothetical protein
MLDALTHFSLVKRENTRFETLVRLLREITGANATTNRLNILTLINHLLNADNYNDLIEIKTDLRDLDLSGVVKEIADNQPQRTPTSGKRQLTPDELLANQIEIFEKLFSGETEKLIETEGVFDILTQTYNDIFQDDPVRSTKLLKIITTLNTKHSKNELTDEQLQEICEVTENNGMIKRLNDRNMTQQGHIKSLEDTIKISKDQLSRFVDECSQYIQKPSGDAPFTPKDEVAEKLLKLIVKVREDKNNLQKAVNDMQYKMKEMESRANSMIQQQPVTTPVTTPPLPPVMGGGPPPPPPPQMGGPPPPPPPSFSGGAPPPPPPPSFGGGPPPPPPPIMGGGPPPPPPPQMGGPPPPPPPSFGGPPPPPPMGGGPPPPPPPVMGGGPPPPPPPIMGGGPPPPPPMGGGPPPPPRMGGGPPPPPGMGGPPPPPGMGGPPPPGIGAMPLGPPKPNLPPLPEYKPKEPTKNIHWLKVEDRVVENTIWIKGNLSQELAKVTLHGDDIEEMFANKKVVSKDNSLSSPEKPKEICLLDSNRARQISIFIGSVRKSNEELVESVINMDESKLSVETTQKLMANAPLPDEISAINTYEDDLSLLSKPDQFIRAMMKVPRLKEKLEAWLFKLNFQKILGETQPDILTVVTAVNQLRESEKWKSLLQIILAIGNYLNGGTKKGGVYGFKIKSLNKLNDTRSTDNKTTLLQYIVTFIEKDYPGLLNFKEELSSVEPASRVSFDGLDEEVKKLKVGLKQAESELETAKKLARPENEKFIQVMGQFVEDSQKQVQALDDEYAKMKKELESLAVFYGEDTKQFMKQPDEFLTEIRTFITAFDKAKELNDKEREKKRKDAERESRKTASPVKSPPTSPIPDVQVEDDNNIYDTTKLLKKFDRRKQKTMSIFGGQPLNFTEMLQKQAKMQEKKN